MAFTVALVLGLKYDATFRKELSRSGAVDTPRDQVVAKAYKGELRGSSVQVEGFGNVDIVLAEHPKDFWRFMSFTLWFDWGNAHYASWLETLGIVEIEEWGPEKKADLVEA